METEFVISVSQNKHPNPYVGPRAFQHGETLYGRDREVMDLLDLLIAERIVLLYSPSGAGKTSLVQARLIPELEQEDFHVLPVMRAGLESPPLPNHPASLSPNRYVLSLFLSLEEALPPEQQTDLTKLAGMTLVDYLDRWAVATDTKEAQVLILDQFEEILTVNPTDRAAKEEFFAQVGAALRDRRRWALFVMREDYVAGLDPYLRPIPTQFSTTYRLELLDRHAALDAIEKPAHQVGVDFDPTAAAKLTDDLRRIRVQRPDGTTEEQLGLYVEPVQLQVVCRRLWEKLPSGTTQIGETDVEAVGDVDTALSGYYAERVAAIAGATGVRERAIREWFDQHLMTEQGIRGQVLQGPERSEGLDNVAIWPLVDAHLVRAEKRRGATWFELAHDRLIGPIQTDNAIWRETHLSALQRQAALWESEGRPSGLLLRDQALAEAEAWTVGHRDELTGIESNFLHECQEAQAIAEREQRQARRIRQWAIGATVLFLIAAMLGIVALTRTQEANRERKNAEIAVQAEAAAKLTAEAIAVAEREARDAADNARAAAEAERQRADQERENALAAAEAEAIARQFAEQQSHVAQSRALAAKAENIIAQDPQLAILLGLEAVYQTHHYMTGTMTIEASDVLQRAVQQSHWLATLHSGHADRVNDAEWSADDAYILTASDDGSAKVWDAATGAEILTLIGHHGGINRASWNSDDTRIATASDDGSVKVWDAKTGAEILTLSGHLAEVSDVTWRSDDRHILTTSNDGTAKVWDANTGAALITLGEGAADITYAAWSSDETRIVTTIRNGTAKVWDAMTGEELMVLQGHEFSLTYAAWNTDDTRLATAGWDAVEVWDTVTGSMLFTINVSSEIQHVAWSPDDTRIAIAIVGGGTIKGGEISVWDASNGKKIATILGPSYYAAWNSEGTRIVNASFYSAAGVWDANTGDRLFTLSGHSSSMNRVAWSSDDASILTASDDSSVKVWDAATGEERFTLGGHNGDINSAMWNSSGTRIVTASGDGTAKVWDAATGTEILTFRGHKCSARDTCRVNYAAWSTDDTRVVTASDDGTAEIWNATTGMEISTLSGHTGYVLYAAWNSDNTRLITTGGWGDKSARIWDTATGREIVTLNGHTDNVYYAAWSPDDWLVMTVSEDRTAKVWDAVTGREIVTLGGGTIDIERAMWSPDGTRIVTAGGWEGTSAHVWDVATGTELFALSGHTGDVDDAVWSPSGRYILTTSADGTAKVWDALTRAERLTFSDDTCAIALALWSPDGARIVTACGDGTAKIWDVATATVLFTLNKFLYWGFGGDAIWSPDGTRIVTINEILGHATLWDATPSVDLFSFGAYAKGAKYTAWNVDNTRILVVSTDGMADVWDVDTGARLFALAGHGGEINSAAWNSSGTRIVTAGGDGVARVWDAGTGDVMLTFTGHECVDEFCDVFYAAWSADDLRIVTTGIDGTARVWDAETGEALLTFTEHKHDCTYGPACGVYYSAWSSDDSRIVTTGADETARVWDSATGTELVTFTGHLNAVSYAAWSPDDERIVTIDRAAGETTVWDARTGMEIFSPSEGHTRPSTQTREDIWRLMGDQTWGINQATWSPDGIRLVTASGDGTAKVWDEATGQELLTLGEHSDRVLYAAWDANGTRIVTTSRDHTAKVWDANTGDLLFTLTGHTGDVNSAAWSSDDARIVTAGADGHTRIYFARPDDLAAFACTRIGRNLTQAEWEQTMGRDVPYRKTCLDLPVGR
ncbi:MAG: hypothetical protein JXR84_19665 [Anaerolineae bacterium]|nr:hypothetical protein [Anaerolineae bacterium]